MSNSFANIGRIYIPQTCKLIYDIGHQGHRGMALQGKIIFHFERGEHYFNINAIIMNLNFPIVLSSIHTQSLYGIIEIQYSCSNTSTINTISILHSANNTAYTLFHPNHKPHYYN